MKRKNTLLEKKMNKYFLPKSIDTKYNFFEGVIWISQSITYV